MNRHKKLLLYLAVILSCLYPHITSAFDVPSKKGVSLVKIRYWSNPVYTRVVLDISSPARYVYTRLKKDPAAGRPERIVIDIKNAALSEKVKRSIKIDDGMLKRIRTGQYDRGTVRVVLDLASIKNYKIFTLNDPFRIVVDLDTASDISSIITRIETNRRNTNQRHPAVRDIPRRIVIDPGHGGKDPGAKGKGGLLEKDVNLKVAKKLAAYLKKHYKGNVILTRRKDRFLPLEERTAIANTDKADIFLSIHTNASPNRKARGVETYYLNFTTDNEAIKVAVRENATSQKHISDLQFIINDLIKTEKTNESVTLASQIQLSTVSSLRKKYKRVNDNGTKGAPFYVLVGTRMPSILVEISFISNSEEESRLRRDNYLNTIAKGIGKGIVSYLDR